VTRAFAFSGTRLLELLKYFGGLSYLLGGGGWCFTVGALKKKVHFRLSETSYQAMRLSIRSFGIVSMVIFFVGMILAFQMAYVLKTLGVVEYVANIIGVAMVREMGPLLVGMVMTGFAGAAIAAELGTMVVSEEVLALETSALKPINFLVAPRLLASMVMMPLITLVAEYIGVFGGFTVGFFLLDMDGPFYLSRTMESLEYKDVFTGLIKAEAFGILITVIACHEGLRVTGGAQGVGRATTNAVVRSVVAIIVSDLLFTALFYFF
jgi:phospholipid/cholesterol/gamma-HCH transport system permease protein